MLIVFLSLDTLPHPRNSTYIFLYSREPPISTHRKFHLILFPVHSFSIYSIIIVYHPTDDVRWGGR